MSYMCSGINQTSEVMKDMDGVCYIRITNGEGMWTSTSITDLQVRLGLLKQRVTIYTIT